MRVSIFGLGYVGTVAGACLAKSGHTVIGIDRNPMKVDFINKGRSPVAERLMDQFIASACKKGKLRATQDSREAVLNSDISLISVGTVINPNGMVDMKNVMNVCRDIGNALRKKRGYHLIAVKSTVLPGSTSDMVIPALEKASGLKASKHFGVCVNPEFLREGDAIADFLNPPFTLIGSKIKKDGLAVAKLYRRVKGPIIHTDYGTAEMVKYASNAFHALKIAFANEIGTISKALGVDAHKVMELFSRDTKLNISKAYLRPGFAFGGSCLSKDLKGLIYKAKTLDIDLPLLNAILPSNQHHIQTLLDMIARSGKKNIGLIGLSFKEGTDDLRESAMVLLAESLIGKGFKLKIFDENVSLARLTGSNKEYIDRAIPHISSLLTTDLGGLVTGSDIIILGIYCRQFRKYMAKLKNDQLVIDLFKRYDEDAGSFKSKYRGICW